MEALDLFFHIVQIAAHHAFRDLDVEQLPVDLRLIRQGADLLHQVTGVKIRTGEVDGNGDDPVAGRFGGLDIAQNLLHHVEIQPGDQQVVLQNRNEHGGHQHAVHRIIPAGQRLHIADLSVAGTDDRLVIHLYPALFHGPVKVVDDLLTDFLLRQHVHIKPGTVGFLALFPGVGSQSCTVAGRADVNRLDPVRIDADSERQVLSVVCPGALRHHSIESLAQPFFRGEGGKIILGKAGAVFAAEMLCQNRRDRTDQPVALIEAVPAVELLQAGQVKEEDRGILILFPQPFASGLCQFIEIGHVRQTGHVIVIGAAVQAFFRQEAVQHLVQNTFVGALLLGIAALMSVPGQAEAHPRFRINASAVGVQNDIIRIF